MRNPIRSIRAGLARLVSEHVSPWRIGLAVAAGVIIGLTPFYSLHTLMTLGLAYALRLNKLASLLGTQVSNPIIALPVIYACVHVGNRILYGAWYHVSFSDFSLVQAKVLFLDWLVGGLVLGVLLGTLLGLFSAWLVVRRRKRLAARTQDPAAVGSAK
ncbi:MAG: DUF2062 domain-containing protein [Candidatus Alcyoniella australis]|nr:DUF2062 domain-containing protein [Candidatus Alcyoniella australis]